MPAPPWLMQHAQSRRRWKSLRQPWHASTSLDDAACTKPEAQTLQGLRILDHGCDTEIDDPDTPLALWEALEKEVTGGWLRAILVRFPH